MDDTGPDVPLEWLADPERMCPLLAAYDQHLAGAQRDARTRERHLKRAQDRASLRSHDFSEDAGCEFPSLIDTCKMSTSHRKYSKGITSAPEVVWGCCHADNSSTQWTRT